MKWTLRKAEKFVQLNVKGCEGKYRFRAREIADWLGCTKPVIQSMRRKAGRLERLGMRPIGPTFALLLLVPEYFIQTKRLSEISAYAHREFVPVKPFIRRNRTTGRPNLVSSHKRNIAINSSGVCK